MLKSNAMAYILHNQKIIRNKNIKQETKNGIHRLL